MTSNVSISENLNEENNSYGIITPHTPLYEEISP